MIDFDKLVVSQYSSRWNERVLKWKISNFDLIHGWLVHFNAKIIEDFFRMMIIKIVTSKVDYTNY